jgi:exopolysaccharide production protein ExoY
MSVGANTLKHVDFLNSSMSAAQDVKLPEIGLRESFATVERVNRFYASYGKRIFDFALALMMLPILAPVISILWFMARRDGGPGFFGHLRVGKDGKVFKCWKIRTMVPDAQKRLDEYLKANPDAAEEWEADHKLTNDPRVTRIGGFLRKTSLDELPQIWNVLMGEMSFVGPRPIVRAELTKYGSYKKSLLSMTPGITGLWQVSGRNDVSYSERVAMDVEYMKSIGFFSDTKVIFQTGMSVLAGTGK